MGQRSPLNKVLQSNVKTTEIVRKKVAMKAKSPNWELEILCDTLGRRILIQHSITHTIWQLSKNYQQGVWEAKDCLSFADNTTKNNTVFHTLCNPATFDKGFKLEISM